MNTLIALLRAVNAGGTGKLPMDVLRGMCEQAGFKNVRTYIQFGNAVFDTGLPTGELKAPRVRIVVAPINPRPEAAMKDESGSIRASIQGQGCSTHAAARERAGQVGRVETISVLFQTCPV